MSIEYNFNKPFYKQLTSIQSIQKLDIRDRFENLDYDQFLEFDFLEDLTIFTEKLPVDFLLNVLKLDFLTDFVFSFSKFYLSASRFGRGYYLYRNVYTNKITKRLDSESPYECLADLVEEINRLKDENPAYLRNCLI